MSTSEALIALFVVLGVITIMAFFLKKICEPDPSSRTGKIIIATFCSVFALAYLFLKLSPPINPSGLSSDKLIEEKIAKLPFVDLIISRNFGNKLGHEGISKIETILAFLYLIILLIILFIKVFKKK